MMIHAYNGHCTLGQSPIWQVDSTKKFLKDHANNNDAKARLNRFAQINGNAKNKVARAPKIAKNIPGFPNEVPAVCQPVITKFLLSIMTNGCVVQNINKIQSIIPIVCECFMVQK